MASSVVPIKQFQDEKMYNLSTLHQHWFWSHLEERKTDTRSNRKIPGAENIYARKIIMHS